MRWLQWRQLPLLEPKQVVPLQHHPLLCRPIVTTVRCYQKEEEDSGTPKQAVKERLEGERGYTPLKVDWKTSIEYMESKAYYDTYGDEPVWKPYRRNFPGHFTPETRKKCIRKGEISTGSACPVCRDDYLVIDYRNLKLLKQLVREETGEPFPSKRTGLCRQQQRKLELELAKAVDYGYMETVVPYRSYDYKEYKKILAERKQQQQKHKGSRS